MTPAQPSPEPHRIHEITGVTPSPLTFEEAETLNEFHYTGDGPCKVTIGPRGGKTYKITRVRRNGRTKTWKTRPGYFSVPVRYGVLARDQFRISHQDAAFYHPSSRCPIGVR